MADFKIKSTAGTGNLTLLQSQDQSGSDYAIKIGDSGASTLTNATLTAPNLGTPSAITLTNATFPAGHPVAETFFTQSPDRVYISASGSDTIISVDCNFVSTSNKMLVLASIGGNMIGTGGELDLEIQDGSSTLRDFAQCMRWSASTSISILRNRVQVSIVDYLTVPSTGSVTISIVGKPATQDFEFQDGNQISTLFVQEIKS